MFSSEAWLANPSSGFYNGEATRSLRFDKASSSYAIRQNSTATDAQKWTLSVWLKRTTLGAEQGILGSGSTAEYVRFESNDTIRYRLYTSSAQQISMITNAVFRDTTNFFHFVCAVDLSNTTDNDKVIMYANGTRLTLGTNTTTTTDTFDSLMNANTLYWNLGRFSGYFGGYMSDVHIIDGQQLTPTSFAESKNGAWIAKKFSGGSYGNNGARLEFKQTGDGSSTASASTIGADTSGNNNHFLDANVNAHDSNMPDSPENNFAILNTLHIMGSPTFSEGNLKLTGSGTDYDRSYATIGLTTGKWYAEFYFVSGDDRGIFGVVREDSLGLATSSNYIGSQANDYGMDFRARAKNNGSNTFDETNFDTGDIGLLCFDIDNGKLWFGRRDVSGSTTIWYDSSGNNNGDPSAGSNPTYTFTATGYTWYIGCHDYNGTTIIANFGQDGSFAGAITSQGASDSNSIGDFNYIESGFLALCTSNLPEPTISPNATNQSSDFFNTVLYTGNGSTTQNINIGFNPDLVWIKSRSNASNHHSLVDSSRGDVALNSNQTAVEYSVAAFNFKTDNTIDVPYYSGDYSMNTNTSTYVAWNWKANGGTTTTNDASATSVGTIDSTYQANTDAGFSIVTYTGTGSAGTLAHGLGAVPKFIIIKNRESTQNWVVYHASNTSAPATDNLYLNLTSATDDEVGMFNDTAPTSTVFSIGTNANVNNNTEGHLAYVFSEVEGFSKFGTYKGNGNADGTFVYTGFRPAWIMIKRTDTTASWYIYDFARLLYNPLGSLNQPLLADTTGAEGGADASWYIDGLSNGFKLKNASNFDNASGGTYIYMAFAENPFKYSNAR